MNIAIIFAGGRGQRLNGAPDSIPKQFLEINKKPILIHTLSHFQQHPEIDKIYISMLSEYIDYTEKLVKEYEIDKVQKIVEGGETRLMPIFKGKSLEKIGPIRSARHYFLDYAMENDAIYVHYGQSPQITLFMPLLEGIDGVEKMSKSLGNYIGVNEDADIMYTKVMKIPDNMIIKYYELCTDVHPDEIAKIIERDDLIEMYVSDRKVLYVFDNNIIQTRLIDGTFPDTNRLIPESFDYELDIDTHYLLNAIDRVSLLNNEQNNIIKLDMSNEKVILSSYMQEIGSVEEILDRSFYKGDSLSISFSSKYATDALRAFNEPKVKILFTGAMKPFIVKDYEKDDLIQLVLPVRTY